MPSPRGMHNERPGQPDWIKLLVLACAIWEHAGVSLRKERIALASAHRLLTVGSICLPDLD